MRRFNLAYAIIAPFLLFGSPSGANNPNRGLAVSNEAYLSALKAVLACTGAKPKPATCTGHWRNIDWLLSTRTWNAQLDLPSGVRWLVTCHRDEIYDENSCSWTTGDEFVVIRGDGYDTLVSWGLRRFPKSEMVGRFDRAVPFSTSSTAWSSMQSSQIYRKMMTAKMLRYRWYSWPQNYERGGSLNLTGFADAAAFMEAIRDDFSASHALNSSPAN